MFLSIFISLAFGEWGQIHGKLETIYFADRRPLEHVLFNVTRLKKDQWVGRSVHASRSH